MVERKIVIIRGKSTAGKSTISYELVKVLPGWIFVDPWKIKEMFEPLGLTDRSVSNRCANKSAQLIMREVVQELGLNIIVQETTKGFVEKSLQRDWRKNHYHVYSFFLDVNLENAIKRDIKRDKPTIGIGKNATSQKEWVNKNAKSEMGDIVIDTNCHSVKDVVKIILKEIKEKKKKNPCAHLIRKVY